MAVNLLGCRDMNYVCAAGIGAVSGLRSLAGPAIISEAANRKVLDLRRGPFAWLGSGNASRSAALLAVGELIADKLPFTPDRTNPPSLVFRAISGAVCGYAICGRGRSRQQKWMSAVVGASAALASSWAGLEYRRRVKLPPLLAAVVEDAVAVGAGAAVVAAIGH
jgi:uncharacterized membrane protein